MARNLGTYTRSATSTRMRTCIWSASGGAMTFTMTATTIRNRTASGSTSWWLYSTSHATACDVFVQLAIVTHS